MHKIKKIKLKHSLGAFYAIWPGNGLCYSTAPGAPHEAVALGDRITIKSVTVNYCSHTTKMTE